MSRFHDSTMRFRWTGPAAIAVAVLVAGAATGCAQRPTSDPGAAPATPVSATASSSPSSSPSPTPSSVPLSCDDLVPKGEIVQALAAGQRADDWVVVPASTVDGTITGVQALKGAGGLSCSWKAGPPNADTGVPTLTVSILPGAADEWTGALYGDSPTPQRRTFAGISAAATCGDPGCGATAAVGSSWVRVDLFTGSREGGPSAFAKQTDDQVFADVRPAVETVFRAVQHANASDLRFPDHLPTGGTAPCTNFLKKVPLADLLDVKRTSIDTHFRPDPKIDSLFGAAEQRIGDSVCIVEDPQYSMAVELASVTTASEQAWAVDDIAEHPAERGDLHETQLKGQQSGERALTSCSATRTQCTVLFTLGSTAIQIDDAQHAERVAESIIAVAR